MAELKVGSYPDEGVSQLASCREKSTEQAEPERTPVGGSRLQSSHDTALSSTASELPQEE